MADSVNNLYHSLSSDLQAIIKTINVKTNDRHNLSISQKYQLFLPSTTEVGGNTISESTFDYFINESNRQMSSNWWLRTADTSSGFNYVDTNGKIQNYRSASSTANAYPIFVVGVERIEPKNSLSDYTWEEIKTIASYRLDSQALSAVYNINAGDYMETTYGYAYLVDTNNETYDGLVFLYVNESDNEEYHHGPANKYDETNMSKLADSKYDELEEEIKNVLTPFSFKLLKQK